MRTDQLQSIARVATVRILILSCMTLSASGTAVAANMEQAKVTKAVNDVRILRENRSPVPARPGNVVSGTTSVGTGDRSRAELEFSDQSLVRLGSNSIFGFKSGEREIELKQGSLLLQVPKGHGRTRIKSLPITAAITGTTIFFECSKKVVDGKGKEVNPGIVKLIVMEGSMEWSLNSNPNKKLRMKAGDMVVFPANARAFPRKVKVDLGRLRSTSLLMDAGMGKLPEMKRVEREITTQKEVNKDANHPTSGFPVKSPKPDNTDNRVRATEIDRVVIPKRPER